MNRIPQAVANYLIEQGVDPEQLYVGAVGERLSPQGGAVRQFERHVEPKLAQPRIGRQRFSAQ